MFDHSPVEQGFWRTPWCGNSCSLGSMRRCLWWWQQRWAQCPSTTVEEEEKLLNKETHNQESFTNIITIDVQQQANADRHSRYHCWVPPLRRPQWSKQWSRGWHQSTVAGRSHRTGSCKTWPTLEFAWEVWGRWDHPFLTCGQLQPVSNPEEGHCITGYVMKEGHECVGITSGVWI